KKNKERQMLIESAKTELWKQKYNVTKDASKMRMLIDSIILIAELTVFIVIHYYCSWKVLGCAVQMGRIGALRPENGVKPCYLQIYIYDTQHELQHRINAIPNSNLDSTIIQNLTTMFDEINLYVINFRYISKLPAKNFRCLSMLIHADILGLDQRTYNNPTASQDKNRDIIDETSDDDNGNNIENGNSSIKQRRKFESTMEFYAYKLQIQPIHSKTVIDYDLPELLPETINRELPIMLIEELSYKVISNDFAKANTLNES
ncbi:17985_t:CDS:2, partial [Cetraspora pellucida]